MLYTKGKNIKLSLNFNSTEFDCHGAGCCSTTEIDGKLVEYLQKIRTHFNAPVTINSAYRCTKHNASIGGASGSKHKYGQAADISVKGITPAEVAKYAESLGILGIGLYETAKDGYFVHIDTRTSKSFWYGQAQAYRSTFGGKPATTNSNSVELKRGDQGDKVKDLQKKLIFLNYNCGTAGVDGDFGTSTESAVKKFQHDMKLVEDGIAGNKTLTALDNVIKKSVKITASVLNVRAGAGTNYKIVNAIPNGTICEVVEEKSGWAKIVKPNGWVSLQYCKRYK